MLVNVVTWEEADRLHTLIRRFAHGWQRVSLLRLSSGPTLRLLLIFGQMGTFVAAKE